MILDSFKEVGLYLERNLLKIIDLIYDNIPYGSEVKDSDIEKWFSSYPIQEKEKKEIYQELELLNIKIVHTKESMQNKLRRLQDRIHNNEIEEDILIQWFLEEKIEENNQDKIRKALQGTGYTIKKEALKEEIDYSFLDEIEVYDLDDVLDDEDFIQEVRGLEDVIHSKWNSDYIYDIQSGDEELKEEGLHNIVKANEKLVWRIVLPYRVLVTPSYDLDDMYQAGMQGLLKAAHRFDPSKGFQFSTYATWWIKQAVTRDIADSSNTVRIPVHMHEKLNKLRRAENDFFNKHFRDADTEYLACTLEISKEEVEDLKTYRHMFDITSLNLPVGENLDTELGHFIPENNECSVEDLVITEELKNVVSDIMTNRLSDREKNILNMRFGLEGNDSHTLEEIGKFYQVTRERIRQIEEKALRKLKAKKIKETLEVFLYHD